MINSKNYYFPKLSSNIASESRGSKQYWNIIKSLTNYDTTDSRSIPPLQVGGDLICDNKEKAKIFNGGRLGWSYYPLNLATGGAGCFNEP